MTCSGVARSALLSLLLLAAMTSAAGAFGQLGTINPVGGGPDDANFSLSSPGEIRRAPDGTFFVVDSGNSKVVRLSADGRYLYAFGGPSSGNDGTRNPTSIALAPSGGPDPDVLVATQFGVIKRFSATGTYIAKFTLAEGQPGYLEVDPSWGDLYVASYSQNNVKKIAMGDSSCTPGTDQFGDVLETFGQGAGMSDFLQPGKLWNPHGIAFDSTGRIIIADRNQRRVSVFKRTSQCAPWTYDTFFGSNTQDAPDQMSAPENIAIDRGSTPNKIYVTNNFLNNVVLAFAGGPDHG